MCPGTLHLSVLAIIPSDSCHCPDLGHCGLRGFEVIDESYPFIHYWRRRSKPRHPGYHRNSPADQTEVKRGREQEEDLGEGEGHLSKEVQVRSKGEEREMHREQGSWLYGNSIPFLFHSTLCIFYSSISSQILRLSLCPALCSKEAQRSKNNISDGLRSNKKVNTAFPTW